MKLKEFRKLIALISPSFDDYEVIYEYDGPDTRLDIPVGGFIVSDDHKTVELVEDVPND